MKPHTNEVSLQKGAVLFDTGDVVTHCYFPLDTAAASYLVFLDNGDAVEAALVGSEGCIGGIVSQGRLPAFSRAAVLNSGNFCRISCKDLADLAREAPGIEGLLRRYADCVMAQLFQSIACNVTHSIEQRAAKWICEIVDLTQNNIVSMTQEQLAARMGSGRSYASRVIQRFKRDGLLRTHRGSIEVLDIERLRERACDCNQAVHQHARAIMRR